MTDRLTVYLRDEGVDAEAIHLDAPARTVADAARLPEATGGTVARVAGAPR